MMNKYKLEITHEEGQPTIHFSNNTKQFVEVVFTIDGKDVKYGKELVDRPRGYGYPPLYRKNIKRMARGIRITEQSAIKAYIYEGEGKYQEVTQKVDFDIPPFIRRRLGESFIPQGKKLLFRRLGRTPQAVLEYSR